MFRQKPRLLVLAAALAVFILFWDIAPRETEIQGQAIPIPIPSEICPIQSVTLDSWTSEVRSAEIPGNGSLTLTAAREYEPASSLNDRKRLVTDYEFSIPEKATVVSGRPGHHGLSLQVFGTDAEPITCFYRGDGTRAFSAPGCGENGASYRFSFCAKTKFAVIADCLTDAQKCLGNREIALPLKAGDLVRGRELLLSVDGGDPCARTEARIVLDGLRMVSGVRCGDVLTEDTILTNDLNCGTRKGWALAIRGEGIRLNGNGFSIEAPQASAGVLVFANEGARISDLNLALGTEGVGFVSVNARGVALESVGTPRVCNFGNGSFTPR